MAGEVSRIRENPEGPAGLSQQSTESPEDVGRSKHNLTITPNQQGQAGGREKGHLTQIKSRNHGDGYHSCHSCSLSPLLPQRFWSIVPSVLTANFSPMVLEDLSE